MGTVLDAVRKLTGQVFWAHPNESDEEGEVTDGLYRRVLNPPEIVLDILWDGFRYVTTTRLGSDGQFRGTWKMEPDTNPETGTVQFALKYKGNRKYRIVGTWLEDGQEFTFKGTLFSDPVKPRI